jgi:hypothetical protein
MTKQIGRNDPCPCGSGRKHKNCCLSRNDKDAISQFKTSYRFDAGSYGDVGRFTPSLACLKLTGKGEWQYHFILVKPQSVHSEEDQATAEAENDISEAYKVKDVHGSDVELAIELSKKGYLSVDDFKIVGESKFHS